MAKKIIKKVCCDCMYNNKLGSGDNECPFTIYISRGAGFKQKFGSEWNDQKDFCSTYKIKRDRKSLLGEEVSEESNDTATYEV